MVTQQSSKLYDAGSSPVKSAIKFIIMTELEERIVELREEGMTYHAIQLKLGNPSKKMIRQTIRKYIPELAGDVVENRGRWK